MQMTRCQKLSRHLYTILDFHLIPFSKTTTKPQKVFVMFVGVICAILLVSIEIKSISAFRGAVLLFPKWEVRTASHVSDA